MAGCDPGISVLSRHVQAAGVELVLAHRNSSQALSLLKEGCVHMAGTHLKDEASGESEPAGDRPPVSEELRGRDLICGLGRGHRHREAAIRRAFGESRTSRGRTSRSSIREKGSGSRGLLDSRLKRWGSIPGRCAVTIGPRRGIFRQRGRCSPARWIVAWRPGRPRGFRVAFHSAGERAIRSGDP